jgi:hypothetical protein
MSQASDQCPSDSFLFSIFDFRFSIFDAHTLHYFGAQTSGTPPNQSSVINLSDSDDQPSQVQQQAAPVKTNLLRAVYPGLLPPACPLLTNHITSHTTVRVLRTLNNEEQLVGFPHLLLENSNASNGQLVQCDIAAPAKSKQTNNNHTSCHCVHREVLTIQA